MELITSLVSQLQNKPPATPSGQIISFQIGDDFSWDPNHLCIFYDPQANNGPQLLLHELGHALLGHNGYKRDIELISMERSAWNKALELSSEYEVQIPMDLIEEHLDTYRDWLHSRSLCPNCSFTGLQTGRSVYCCPSCQASWRVNQARACGLKRHLTK